MIRIRKASERGVLRNAWPEARMTFSFGDYRDCAYDGYSALEVLNEDRAAPGGGFALHGHQDIEAISYVLEGEIEHRDNLGHVSRLRVGDVQRISAGHGIAHSEMNASGIYPEHHLQIWIRPARAGLTPGYAQRHFAAEGKTNRLALLVSPDGAEGSLVINRDVRIWASVVTRGAIEYRPPSWRRTFVHVARGSLVVNDSPLDAGDGAFVEHEPHLELRSDAQSEVLMFDLL